jgi:hypothetical protein
VIAGETARAHDQEGRRIALQGAERIFQIIFSIHAKMKILCLFCNLSQGSLDYQYGIGLFCFVRNMTK